MPHVGVPAPQGNGLLLWVQLWPKGPQGLGLGRALCQGIAKGHGGIMTAESRQGKGSRFTFSMPDRLSGAALSDVRFDYSGGFNRALMSLSDTLPSEAFTIRNH